MGKVAFKLAGRTGREYKVLLAPDRLGGSRFWELLRRTVDRRRGRGTPKVGSLDAVLERSERPTRSAARHTMAIVATFAVGLFAGFNASSAADERAAALDKAIPAALERASIPGVIVGMWQEGREPYVRAFGVSNTATGAPMTTDMHVRIGSNSKTFTVAAILMLADQGKLSLDDPIDRYVEGVPSGDRITLRMLAAMRSGIHDYLEETSSRMLDQTHRQWAAQELIEIGLRLPRLFPPGSAFDYSNTNTVLLGVVVEKVSGQSLGSFIVENILEPLGLAHTVFPLGNELPSPYSHGYFGLPDGKVVDATDWNPSWGWASGNMISTLDDMRVWARSLAMGELISPAMKKERDEFLPAPGEGDGSLYGLALENQNGWIGHNGNVLSYMAYPYYLPSEGITLVVLLNSGANVLGSWLMMQDIVRIVSPDHPWPGLPKE